MNKINQIIELWKNEYLDGFDDVRKIYFMQDAADKELVDKYVIYKIITDTLNESFYNKEMYPDAVCLPKNMEHMFFQNAIGDIDSCVSYFTEAILSRGINKIALFSDSYYFRGRRFGKFLQVMKERGWIPNDILVFQEGSGRLGLTYIIFKHDNT